MRKVVIYIEEVWKDINEFEGYYQVSNLGSIKSLFRYVKVKNGFRSVPEKILTPKIDKDGYLRVVLQKDVKSRHFAVHRFVADAFVEIPNNLPHFNHKNENKKDNRMENLEWCTEQYNCNYGNRNKKLSESKHKAINQYSLKGVLIREWESGVCIEKETGFNRKNISACCRGVRKTAYGYIWKFVC